MAKKVVTFGELMMRLSPEGYFRFVQADKFQIYFGGAEANVAVSAANYGLDASFVTKLPEHEIGQAGVNALRRYGVDTSCIARGGNRMGIYFMEKGASQRASGVIYDRAGSSFANASGGDFDWEHIFDGADWFHFSGITPALNDDVAEICLDACKAARKAGVTVSCDLNYREKLWTVEKARTVMKQLAPYIDVCITTEEEADQALDIRAKSPEGTVRERSRDVAKQLADACHFKQVAIMILETISASDSHWSAMVYDGSEYYFSKEYDIRIIDRCGIGDAFGGGFIAANLYGYDAAGAAELGAAASCLKNSIEGDFNLVSFAEVERLAGGDGRGHIKR